MQKTVAAGRRVCHKPAIWQKTKERIDSEPLVRCRARLGVKVSAWVKVWVGWG